MAKLGPMGNNSLGVDCLFGRNLHWKNRGVMTAKTRARKCPEEQGVQLIAGAAEVPVGQPWVSAPHPGRTINRPVVLSRTKAPACSPGQENSGRGRQCALPGH